MPLRAEVATAEMLLTMGEKCFQDDFAAPCAPRCTTAATATWARW
jgi:hypothetical protein